MQCDYLCNRNSKCIGSSIKAIPNLVYWHCIGELRSCVYKLFECVLSLAYL